MTDDEKKPPRIIEATGNPLPPQAVLVPVALPLSDDEREALRREGAREAIEAMMPLLYDYTGLRLGFGPMATRRPTHGRCCTCQECGFEYDSCICEHNEIYDKVARLRARYAEPQPEREGK